ncbi:MAG: MerR family transcriptional regulator [Gaiellaceae bacterium]
MAAHLNIAALAQRTGVAPDTLRKWEQRYGVLRPQRTPGGQRRYTQDDVDRIEWLLARLREGYRIGEAASLLELPETATAQSPDEFCRALLSATAHGNAPALERLLDAAFALHPRTRVFSEIVRPLLEAVGEGWAEGEISVGQEHLVTGAVRARLERYLTDGRRSPGPTAVLACVPGERHELGLMMLGAMLRSEGWDVLYLGADTPSADAVGVAESADAQVLALSASREEPLQGLRRVSSPDELQTVLGGRGATPDAAERLGATLGERDLGRASKTLERLAR